MARKIGVPFNSIFSWLIKKRLHQIDLFLRYPVDVQFDVFETLISTAKATEFGKAHNFERINSYSDFKENIPLQSYEDVVPFIDRLKAGEKNVLWPSDVKWFAKSSGTTGAKSKFIPVTKEALEGCHYKGGKDLLAMYYKHHPRTKLFKGKHLILGGSAQINYLKDGSYFGDLSAIIVKNLPWWCEFRRTPKKEITLLDQWEEKLERMVDETIHEDVHILAGVPSWTLVLLKRILEKTGAKDILEVWPNLELYMHGGVNFEPYRKQFEKMIPKKTMNYVQTYNASEGFFGIQDRVVADDMLLMLDYGVFYEFIPMSEFHQPNPKTINIEDVKEGVNYALVISTNAGLWRYVIGDTIKFTSLTPHRFKITGRTKQFINAFGEELIVENADYSINEACKKTNSFVKDYTVCPVFMADNDTGGHQWLVEFEKEPENLDNFINILDDSLKSVNSDYEAKRTNDLTMKLPLVNKMKKGTFYDWLKSKGKLGGQYKVPKLANNRTIVDEVLKIENEKLS